MEAKTGAAVRPGFLPRTQDWLHTLQPIGVSHNTDKLKKKTARMTISNGTQEAFEKI